MKRLLPLLTLIIALSGCAVKEAPAAECLSDTLELIPEPAALICVDLPPEALLTASARDGKSLLFECRDCEILEEIFRADSAQEAAARLTGMDDPAIYTLRREYPMEYRFAWSSAGEDGALLCSTTLLYDGSFWYAVTFRCSEASAAELRELSQEVLSSVCLESI